MSDVALAASPVWPWLLTLVAQVLLLRSSKMERRANLSANRDEKGNDTSERFSYTNYDRN